MYKLINNKAFEKVNFYDEKRWSGFKSLNFPSEAFNLNSANLGTLSYNANRFNYGVLNDVYSSPIKQYILGREFISKCKSEIKKIYPTAEFHLNVSFSATQLASLISESLNIENKKSVLVTTNFEHIGGISPFFENFQINYLDLNKIKRKDYLFKIKPDVIFISHYTYQFGEELPVRKIYNEIKSILPNCIVIVDIAQSIGISEIPFDGADILFGSSHKWMFGARGKGFVWYKKKLSKKLKGVLKGDKLQKTVNLFEIGGGQDFVSYIELYKSIDLINQIGLNKIITRTKYLKNYFKNLLSYGLNIEILNVKNQHPGFITVRVLNGDIYKMYKMMENKKLYVKCFKDLSMFRISIPYYETKERLYLASKLFGDILCGNH